MSTTAETTSEPTSTLGGETKVSSGGVIEVVAQDSPSNSTSDTKEPLAFEKTLPLVKSIFEEKIAACRKSNPTFTDQAVTQNAAASTLVSLWRNLHDVPEELFKDCRRDALFPLLVQGWKVCVELVGAVELDDEGRVLGLNVDLKAPISEMLLGLAASSIDPARDALKVMYALALSCGVEKVAPGGLDPEAAKAKLSGILQRMDGAMRTLSSGGSSVSEFIEGSSAQAGTSRYQDMHQVQLNGGQITSDPPPKGDKKGKGKEVRTSKEEMQNAWIFAPKLPHGHVRQEALPDNLEGRGYIAPRIIASMKPEENPAYLDNHVAAIMTSIPPIYYGLQDNPDGHTAWFTSASSKVRYLAAGTSAKEIWPKPVPKIPSKIVIRTTDDGMGLGVFATQDIKRFEPVLVERPFVVYPRSPPIPVHSEKAKRELSQNQLNQIVNMQAEEIYAAVTKNSMTATARKEFMKLANSHRFDGSGPTFGIVRTNGFHIRFGDKLPGLDDEFFGRGYGAIARIGSRFNHSCISDVDVVFEPATFTMRFTATRDIKAGSQIFTSYTSPDMTKAERQVALERYGILCTCRACTNATPQSDKLRKVSKTMIANWRRQCTEVWVNDPKLKESVLKPILETKRRMEEEGLDDAHTGYYTLYEIMYRAYQKVGSEKKEKEIGGKKD
ncbi:hypothetical protein EST38_g8720 [Candolleomyces aberdarensis]|uniref:SET domain-containing protein n=1 Tax=Candolleomyces aberdarensis TaxID=2316362 RepID=A0A4Q2DEN7_9AGAR|nr:hypothetical protein EST38_g8720 [Candolleomyces aberdarensis]